MFHRGWRELALDRLGDGFDLVIVGAGISGSGIALDAAQRGLDVLLLERGDIASGTSSRSSKLIHGGLRYLKQMQFRITRLACRERDRMLSLSPHLVRPIRFLYPAYHGDLTPGWQIGLGLWMYDQLTARPEKHTQVGVEEIQDLAPGLPTDDLDRALAYTDAFADDARLTLAVAATAHSFGAAVLTRAEVVGPVRGGSGRIEGVEAHDLETGRVHTVRSHAVVNATGVWTDICRERLGLPGHHLKPSRGIHLVLPADQLRLRTAVTLPAPDDGRPVFLIPHPEGVLVGTTDHYHDGSLDDPRPTEAEVAYLLRAVRAAFPGADVGRDRVVGAFAGVRPILDTHAENPSEASREEEIWEEEGVLSVAGGKLTTWRSTAEAAVDAALQLLPGERARALAPCATRGTPLAGLAPADLDRRLTAVYGLDSAVAEGMARRLGGLAWTAVEAARDRSELRPVADDLDLSPAEVRAHLRWGAALHLDDLLLRRVRLGMWTPDRCRELLPALAPLVRAELDWDAARWDREAGALENALRGWSVEGIVPGSDDTVPCPEC